MAGKIQKGDQIKNEAREKNVRKNVSKKVNNVQNESMIA
jgi:hypothetical protein